MLIKWRTGVHQWGLCRWRHKCPTNRITWSWLRCTQERITATLWRGRLMRCGRNARLFLVRFGRGPVMGRRRCHIIIRCRPKIVQEVRMICIFVTIQTRTQTDTGRCWTKIKCTTGYYTRRFQRYCTWFNWRIILDACVRLEALRIVLLLFHRVRLYR